MNTKNPAWIYFLCVLFSLTLAGVAHANHPDNQRVTDTTSERRELLSPKAPIILQRFFEDGSGFVEYRFTHPVVFRIRITGCFVPRMGCSMKPIRYQTTFSGR